MTLIILHPKASARGQARQAALHARCDPLETQRETQQQQIAERLEELQQDGRVDLQEMGHVLPNKWNMFGIGT